uniref:Aminopeptidase n=1 Tax=Plectus sambesii TaxID=2011161 RepID=A0A914VXW8_9BILA
MRLPTNLIPYEYDLWIRPFVVPDDYISFNTTWNFTTDGNVTIYFTCVTPTTQIVLHGDNIELIEHSLLLTNLATNKADLSITGHNYSDVTQMFTFTLSGTLQANTNYSLHIDYYGNITNDLKGFYWQTYQEYGVTKYMASTQFQPTDARRALPCFDEPAMKAVFVVHIIHSVGFTALANQKMNRTEIFAKGWNATHFDPTKKMSTYLLAFAVADFGYTEMTANTIRNTTIRVWSQKSQVNQTYFAACMAKTALEYYEQYYGYEFPLEKQDLLAVPQLSFGAMENWGLVIYRDYVLLYDNSTYPYSAKQHVAVDVSHELAHQWFGDLVTMAWWDDIWLNEGFASLIEFKGSDLTSACKPDTFDMVDQFVTDVQGAMALDQYGTSHPIYVPVATAAEANQVFDDISYDKGGAVLNQLNHTLGLMPSNPNKTVFLDGLQQYLSLHAYGNAAHDDLWAALQDACNRNNVTGWVPGQVLNVSEYMNRWILQMGFPVVNVTRNAAAGQITLAQQRFLVGPDLGVRSPYNYQWYTPLWYFDPTTGNTILDWIVLDQQKTITNAAIFGPQQSWYLLNPQVYGMYRVNYDAANWNALQKQLLTNYTVIDVRARAQLLDDAFTLSRANMLPYTTALNLASYLPKEMHFVPLGVGMSQLQYIGKMFSQTADYEFYQNYMTNMVKNQSDPKNPINSLNCQFNVSTCVQDANRAFQNLLNTCGRNTSTTSDPTCNSIPPDQRAAVYCTGVANMGLVGLNFMVQKYAIETVGIEKQALLLGMSCVQSRWLNDKLMSLVAAGVIEHSAAGT